MATREKIEIDFLDIDVADVADAKLLEPGERLLRIEALDLYENTETGQRTFNVQLSCPDDPAADHIFETLAIPRPDHSERAKQFMLRNIKNFRTAFGLPLGGHSVAEAIGREAWAIVAQEPPDNDKNGEIRTVVKKWVRRA